MGYTSDDSKVRGDVFKESGKWYETIQLNMKGLYDEALTQDAVRAAFNRDYEGMFKGMTLVVLEPYHKHAHPVSMKLP